MKTAKKSRYISDHKYFLTTHNKCVVKCVRGKVFQFKEYDAHSNIYYFTALQKCSDEVIKGKVVQLPMEIEPLPKDNYIKEVTKVYHKMGQLFYETKDTKVGRVLSTFEHGNYPKKKDFIYMNKLWEKKHLDT